MAQVLSTAVDLCDSNEGISCDPNSQRTHCELKTLANRIEGGTLAN